MYIPDVRSLWGRAGAGADVVESLFELSGTLMWREEGCVDGLGDTDIFFFSSSRGASQLGWYCGCYGL